jgi:hypothetical protein
MRVGMSMGWVAALGGAQVVLLVVPIAFAFEDLAFVPLGSAIGCGLGGVAVCVLLLFGAAAWGAWATLSGASLLERSAMGLILVGVIVIGVAIAFGSSFHSNGRLSIITGILAITGVIGHTTSAAWMWVARVAAIVEIWLLWVLVRAVKRTRAGA